MLHLRKCCLVIPLLFSVTVSADEPLKLRVGADSSVFKGTVKQIKEEGKVIVQIQVPELESNRFRRLPVATVPAEGLFLGWTASSVGGGQETDWASARVFQARVNWVGKNNRVTIKIDPAVAKTLQPGDAIALNRPVGSTTKQMRSVPVVAAVEPSNFIPGLDNKYTGSLNTSVNNLKQIMLALHNYHDTYNQWPPAVIYGPDDKPWHSWRVLILPFLEESALYDQYKFDEPWDGPNNKKLLSKMPNIYRDPVHKNDGKSLTHYAAITGKSSGLGWLYSVDGTPHREDRTKQRLQSKHRISDMIDGTSNTIVMGTITPAHNIPWMKPADIEFGDQPVPLGDKNGFAAPYPFKESPVGLFGFGDGSVQAIHSSIDKVTWTNLLNYQDDQVVETFPRAQLPGGSMITYLEFTEVDGKPVAKLVREKLKRRFRNDRFKEEAKKAVDEPTNEAVPEEEGSSSEDAPADKDE